MAGNNNSGKKEDIEVGHQFLCPLTHLIMLEPTSATDGHTYEREAIEKWFKKVPVSFTFHLN